MNLADDGVEEEDETAASESSAGHSQKMKAQTSDRSEKARLIFTFW